MKILVIGYRNHSESIIRILAKIKRVKKIYIFKRKINKFSLNISNIEFINKLTNLSIYDCYFILSPNNTHVKYIKRLIKFNKKIFCEKPSCTTILEYDYLTKLKKKYKRNIYFNFNLRHTELYELAKKYLKTKKLGKLHHLYFKGANGIAFKKKLKTSKRFNSSNIFDRITGNIGVHYINFFLGLTSPGLVSYKFKINCIEGSTRKKVTDYAKIDIYTKNIFGSIFMTYSSVADYQVELVFTNGVLKFNNNRIILAYPRDSFDINGNYIYPKEKILTKFSSYKDYTKKSFYNSVNYFINSTYNKKSFSIKNFDDSLLTSKVLIKANNKKN